MEILYVNALDHGVLDLDSKLKTSAEGFATYYQEREKRLSQLKRGSIELYISYFPFKQGGKVLLRLKDSGRGFDALQYFKDNQNQKLSGRGIYLVDELCDTLEYTEMGTSVEASYLWH